MAGSALSALFLIACKEWTCKRVFCTVVEWFRPMFDFWWWETFLHLVMQSRLYCHVDSQRHTPHDATWTFKDSEDAGNNIQNLVPFLCQRKQSFEFSSIIKHQFHVLSTRSVQLLYNDNIRPVIILVVKMKQRVKTLIRQRMFKIVWWETELPLEQLKARWHKQIQPVTAHHPKLLSQLCSRNNHISNKSLLLYFFWGCSSLISCWNISDVNSAK